MVNKNHEQKLQQNFIRNVRYRLEKLGWRHQDLADRCGNPREYITTLLGGKHSPSLDTVEAIAVALEVDPEWIMQNNKFY